MEKFQVCFVAKVFLFLKNITLQELQFKFKAKEKFNNGANT